MTIYYFLFGIIFITKGLLQKAWCSSKQKKLFFVFFIGLLLILLMGLRGNLVGVDVKQYINRFNQAGELIHVGYRNSEFGFFFLTYLFHDIFKTDFQFFLFLISVFIVFVLMRFFYEYSCEPAESIIIYLTLGLFSINMSGLRQSIAISLALISLKQIKKRHLLRFVFIILAATYIHNSALVFLPMYFIWNRRINRKQVSILFVITILALLYRQLLNPIILMIAPEKYDKYNLYSNYHINPLVIIVPMAITLFCVCFIKHEEDGKFSENNSLFLFMSLLYLFFTILGMNHVQLARLSFYFAVGNMLLLPEAVKNVIHGQGEVGRFVQVAVMCLCIAYFVISVPGGSSEIDNYRFFWMG